MASLTKLTSVVLMKIVPAVVILLSMNVTANGEIITDRFNNYKKHPGRNIVINKNNYAHHPAGRNRFFVPRTRFYRGTRVMRPYGRPIVGYGFFYNDDDAYKWLAFTSITLKILDNINEEQQRMHEQAQILATTAKIGESIEWQDGENSGSVKTTRIGKSTSGRYCREFQQTISIGRKTEQAYGTACQQVDGSWEIVP